MRIIAELLVNSRSALVTAAGEKPYLTQTLHSMKRRSNGAFDFPKRLSIAVFAFFIAFADKEQNNHFVSGTMNLTST